MSTAQELLTEARAQMDNVRFDPRATKRQLMDTMGIAAEYIDQATAVLDSPVVAPEDPVGPVDEPPPTPTPAYTDWANLLDGAPGLTGVTKWLPGSTGIDLFCARWTIVRAPIGGTVYFEQVPGGPTLIGQMTIVRSDGACCRFRHISTLVQGNVAVPVGTPVARVYDASMDILQWPSGYPTPPDGYQHLDLSLATHPSRLDPTGGAGGDVNAYDHLFVQHDGLPGFTVIQRTPGPPDSGR